MVSRPLFELARSAKDVARRSLMAALMLSVFAAATSAWGQSAKPSRPTGVAPETVRAVRSTARPQSSGVRDRDVAGASATVQPDALPIEVSEAEIDGGPGAVAGARMRLEPTNDVPRTARFHWLQVDGPKVQVEDPEQSSIAITLPGGCDHLGFLLVASCPDRVRVVRVGVVVHGSGRRPSSEAEPGPSTGPRPAGRAKAHAGGDQVGLVGHRVTLNGYRSEPRTGAFARWMQVEGPAVSAPQDHGLAFSFVPMSPGVYRFLLVVAAGAEISEPDEVTVTVGTPPNLAASAAPVGAMPSPQPPAQLSSFEQVLAGSLSSLPDGSRVFSEIADVLQAVADRATLYWSFAALQSELARRLDVVVPAEPALRERWVNAVFVPMSAHTVEQLARDGVDVRSAAAQQQNLGPIQQERLRDHFVRMARVFRSAATVR